VLLLLLLMLLLQSPLMWLNFIAIAISLSGLRRYLDPDSPAALPALGFIDGLLTWFSSACIPVLLFANGVWMSDKQVFSRSGQLQVRCFTHCSQVECMP
jgi:predicted permease